MNFEKSFGLFLTTIALVACDGSARLIDSADSQTQVDNEVALMELLNEEYIDVTNPSIEAANDFEPTLGFALPARGVLAVDTGLIGSTSDGQETRLNCAPGQVLTGLAGFATENRIHRVWASCVAPSATGDWVGEPQSIGSFGSAEGRWFALTCDAGHGITGISGLSILGNVSSLQLHCNKLQTEDSTTGERKTTRSVGSPGALVAERHCGAASVATGMYGRVDSGLRSIGLACHESPASAGRWSNPVDWPVNAVHALLTPDGGVMSYGFKADSDNVFDYDIWTPTAGTLASAHNTFATETAVNGFCNAAVVMPDNGNILMPGGTSPLNNLGTGVTEVPIFNSQSGSQSLAAEMSFRRWYPTVITLPSGEILVVGGRDTAGVPTNTPEIYSPLTNEWRSLFSANTAELGWFYPKLWVMPDGQLFGFSRNQVFYLNTAGSGSLQKADPFRAGSFWSTSNRPAVMYRPNKIMNMRGDQPNLVDLSGNAPTLSNTSKMNALADAWSDLQILPDGTVLAVGGSRKNNDAVTAALNPEIWDPDTDTWTIQSAFKWPRLYHSTTVLLQDGTVLVAGGGNPGPITNYNAEIFSPPYLFKEDGSPAVRPIIDWAPEKGAYGQQINISTTASEVKKVTFIKTSSVTHSWNSEQNYRELPFSVVDNTRISLRLPESPNLATPGYYLLFVLNDKGTPSEAKIIKLGDEPGATEPPTIVTPPAVVATNNILINGDFEQGKTSWLDCSDATFSTVTARASQGQSGLTQTSGACLYQEFFVQPGTSYTITCDAYTQGTAYSSLSMTMLDASFLELSTDSIAVTASTYTPSRQTVTADQDAVIGAVTLYSEGPTFFDACTVTADTTTLATPVVNTPINAPANNLLVNGEFAQGKSNWIDCGNAAHTTIETDPQTAESSLKISGSGCIYQEFPVTAGKQYEMQCEAQSTGSQYSSITFQVTDANYNQLDSETKVIAPGDFQAYRATLTAPQTGTTSAVTLYSEDITRVSACYIEEI